MVSPFQSFSRNYSSWVLLLQFRVPNRDCQIQQTLSVCYTSHMLLAVFACESKNCLSLVFNKITSPVHVMFAMREPLPIEHLLLFLILYLESQRLLGF